ncbi:hypothetical protein LEP1GSC170_2951 [Leptospira interrogans serovar Bataviae str. HAI135]|nr:hypothetical protein LEP1GSC170_2951 [Leptospira interrogans serovar Bataviae str. HAI135]
MITITNCIYTNVKTPGWFYSQSYTDVRGMGSSWKTFRSSLWGRLVLACLYRG